VERYAREITRRLPPGICLARPPRASQGWSGHVWEQAVLPGMVGEDRLWSPANSGPLRVPRQAVTIHDLAVLEHPEWFAPGFALWYRLLLPQLVHRARKVLTVSRDTRDRLVRRFGLDPAALTVIPGGVDHGQFHPQSGRRQAETLARLGLPERYLLFVGSREPRKNLPRLVKAWTIVSRSFPGVELAICGGAGMSFAPSRIDAAPQVRWLGYVADADLPGLYAGATAFVYPSLDEGFGLPVLEAMACGAPVIATTAGAVPEAAGDAALYANPVRVEELAEALYRGLEEQDLREELRARGFERAAGFSWEASASAVQQSLEEIA
jgi:glycosyltransferase involved in cell wall biosynthesis